MTIFIILQGRLISSFVIIDIRVIIWIIYIVIIIIIIIVHTYSISFSLSLIYLECLGCGWERRGIWCILITIALFLFPFPAWLPPLCLVFLHTFLLVPSPKNVHRLPPSFIYSRINFSFSPFFELLNYWIFVDFYWIYIALYGFFEICMNSFLLNFYWILIYFRFWWLLVYFSIPEFFISSSSSSLFLFAIVVNQIWMEFIYYCLIHLFSVDSLNILSFIFGDFFMVYFQSLLLSGIFSEYSSFPLLFIIFKFFCLFWNILSSLILLFVLWFFFVDFNLSFHLFFEHFVCVDVVVVHFRNFLFIFCPNFIIQFNVDAFIV